MIIKHLNLEDINNVYVVTDIHGRYDILKKSLIEIDFKSSDLLISLGDNVDRGENSFYCLYYFTHVENVISGLGNHEEIIRSAIIDKSAHSRA